MSVQKKIILNLAPIMILTIILFTVTFGKLFQNFLMNEENKQVNIIDKKIASFIIEDCNQYQSTADDWGYWDDTYNFIKDNNHEFVKNNLNIDTISNLDISFMVLLNKNNAIFHKIKYNPEQQTFSDFSPKFMNDFDNVIKTSKLKNHSSGVFRLDNRLYFTAITDVTDSNKIKAANGKIIIGKEIDDRVIKILENTTGCKIRSITIGSMKASSADGSFGNVHSIIDRTGSGKDPLKIQLTIPNKTGINSAIIFQMAKTRDLYQTGMKLFYLLSLVFWGIMIVISLLLYILLGKFLSDPIISLVKDVKNINISADELNRVTVNGSNEFAFLQSEINAMLDRIETEQKKLKSSEEKLYALSYHDQLTGLYNRRYFDDELKRTDEKNNLPISIIYADLNGLKTMNDAFGHINGDKLITIFADALKSECRADDIIARIGGDEFIILLPKTDLAHAEKFAKRMKEKIKIIKVMDVPISVSFGCDTKVTMEQPIQDILIKAENIMYKKKTLENDSKKNLVVKSILNTLIVKSPREANHSRRVGMLCESIGKAYHLDDYETIELKTAGELHDIGKIAIDERVLNKTTPLSVAERVQIKEHPEIGYRLLINTHEFYNLAEYVLGHHERFDGTGYPKGLKGEAINWKSRVLSVADAYDAMTSARPYHEIKTKEEAIAELQNKSGTQFDPDIVQVFIEKVLLVNKASA